MIFWKSIMSYLPNTVNPHYPWFLYLHFHPLTKMYLEPPKPTHMVLSCHSQAYMEWETFELPWACISSWGQIRQHSHLLISSLTSFAVSLLPHSFSFSGFFLAILWFQVAPRVVLKCCLVLLSPKRLLHALQTKYVC